MLVLVPFVRKICNALCILVQLFVSNCEYERGANAFRVCRQKMLCRPIFFI